MAMIVVNGYVRTDKGRIRPINEDNFCVNRYFKAKDADSDLLSFGGSRDILAGIFDGIGGEKNGEMASFIAAKTMAAFDAHLPDGDWNFLINDMNRRINEYAKTNGGCNMGSTAAIVFVHKGVAQICNLGDSPIFLCSDGHLRKISKDHNELQRAKDMNLADMNFDTSGIKKNRLTKYLGIRSPELNPNIVVDIELNEGDKLLLCSDGLTGMVAEDEIERIMADGGSERIVNCLVDKALENGGRDNTTVMVLCCEEKKSLIGRLFGK